MSVLPAGRAFAGTFQGRTSHYAIWEMPPALITRVAHEAGMPHAAELTARLSHRDEVLYGSIRRLAELAASPDSLAELEGACIVRSLGLHLLSKYGAWQQPLLPHRRRALLSQRAVAELQDYVDTHLSEKISLADLATVANRTAHNLLIGFRQHFGLTPHQYVLEQRLKRALWQLIRTARPIAEIAYDTGFASQSHMTSAFKSRFGMTPNAARKDLA
jgi:AraC family transcriptional regulator